MGKSVLNVILKEATALQTKLLKPKLFGSGKKITVVFLMLEDHMHEWSNSKNVNLSKHSKITKLIEATKTIHKSILVAFKNTFMTNQHSLVLMFSQNPYKNAIKMTRFMLHNTKIFLFNITKALTL